MLGFPQHLYLILHLLHVPHVWTNKGSRRPLLHYARSQRAASMLHARVKTWHKYKARTSTGDDDIPDVGGERLDDGGGGVAVVLPAGHK